MDRYTVDRMEAAYAVLEGEDRAMHDVPLADLPAGAREGSCLVWDGLRWAFDPAEEGARRARIRAKMEGLFKRRDASGAGDGAAEPDARR